MGKKGVLYQFRPGTRLGLLALFIVQSFIPILPGQTSNNTILSELLINPALPRRESLASSNIRGGNTCLSDPNHNNPFLAEDNSTEESIGFLYGEKKAVRADRPYVLSTWICSDVNYQNSVISIYQYDQTGTVIPSSKISIRFSTTTEWELFEHTLTGLDPLTTSIRLEVRPVMWSADNPATPENENGMLTGRAWFDNLAIFPLYGNQAPDSTFEGPSTSWVTGVTDDQFSHNGNRSFKVEDLDSARSVYAYNQDRIAAYPNTAYMVQAWIRTPRENQQALLAVHQYDRAGQPVGEHLDFYYTSGQEWSLFQQFIHGLDPEVAFLRVLLFPVSWTRAGELTGTAWFDDISVSPYSHNLVSNSDFERSSDQPGNPFENWLGGQRSESDSWQGKAHALLKKGDQLSLQPDSLIAVSAESSYLFTFWSRSDTSAVITSAIQFYDQDREPLPNTTTIQNNHTAGDTWQASRINLEGSEIPPDSRFINLLFTTDRSNTGIDRVTFRADLWPIEGTRLPGLSTVDLWWAPPDQKILSSDRLASNVPQSEGITLYTARNEMESFQLVFCPEQNAILNNVKVSSLNSGGGSGSSNITLTVREVVNVPIGNPTDRNAIQANAIPDPLPLLGDPLNLQAGTTKAIWFTAAIPKNTPAGTYSGFISFRLDREQTTIPLTIHVWNFTLSDDTHLQTSFGLSTGQIKKYYNTFNDRLWQSVLTTFTEHRVSPNNPFPNRWYTIEAVMPGEWRGNAGFVSDPDVPENHVLSVEAGTSTARAYQADTIPVTGDTTCTLEGIVRVLDENRHPFNIVVSELQNDRVLKQTAFPQTASDSWSPFLIQIGLGVGTTHIQIFIEASNSIVSAPTPVSTTVIPSEFPTWRASGTSEGKQTGTPGTTDTPQTTRASMATSTPSSATPTLAETAESAAVSATTAIFPSPAIVFSESPGAAVSSSKDNSIVLPPSSGSDNAEELTPENGSSAGEITGSGTPTGTCDTGSIPPCPGPILTRLPAFTPSPTYTHGPSPTPSSTPTPSLVPSITYTPSLTSTPAPPVSFLFDDFRLTNAGPENHFPRGDCEPLDGSSATAIADFYRFDTAFTDMESDNHFNTVRLYLPGFASLQGVNISNPDILSFPWGTSNYQSAYHNVFETLAGHLYENNWQDQTIVFWADEPSPSSLQNVIYGMEVFQENNYPIRRALTMVYIPLEPGEDSAAGTTMGPMHELNDVVDLWILAYQNMTPEWIESRQQAGDEVWWYLSSGIREPYGNLFIDYPGIDIRSLFWQGWKMDLSGMLYWQTMLWASDLDCVLEKKPGESEPVCPDPWVEAGYYNGSRFMGNGEGRLLYPPRNRTAGSPSTDLVPSIRWELIREGIEDYEILTMLERYTGLLNKHNPHSRSLAAQAESLLARAENLAGSPSSYPQHSSGYAEIRQQIGSLLPRIFAEVYTEKED
ncbi:MAG: DUF4091 domain-containing protein [Anaerolineales bacterium]|nr:DUF4091 domain-containing protein [Anaerolineales bacterium]